jgi:beta-barrel assembly-enhancing protease
MVPGIYFDGETARDRAVTVRRLGQSLTFSGSETPENTWSLEGLHAIDPPAEGQPFRLSHDSAIGARLIIRDQRLIDEIVHAAPHLKGHYGVRHFKHVAIWTVGGLAVLGVLSWFTLTFLPKQVAGLIPDSWRNRTGVQVEQSVAGTYKVCANPAGKEALSKMMAALAEGDSDLPPVTVTVYDMPILNAFAVSGGRVIMTRELIEKADNANEVIGVLAHEVGHVKLLHPEQQLVRVLGLQLLISVATGSNDGDFVSNFAGLAALLRYGREAEREADAYARETLVKAKIDTLGFKTFFEKLLKLSPERSNSNENTTALDRIGDVFSTHPDTQDRINNIQPLPTDIMPIVPLTAPEWQALRDICKT